MAEQVFTIPTAELAAAMPAQESAVPGGKAPPSALESLSETRIYATFEDAEGRALGEAIEVEPPQTLHLEYPNEDGSFGWAESVEPMAFTAEPHPDAAQLSISTEESLLARLPLESLGALETAGANGPKNPERSEQIGAANASFVLPVIAERFTQWEPFVAKVRELHAYILTLSPFNEPAVSNRFAVKALYWTTDPQSGRFGTTDTTLGGGRLFHGDLAQANKFARKAVGEGRISLILINSTRRGGAGGSPGRPAWVSIQAAPGERWEAVALHELGHAFGLADEYLDPNLQNQSPATLEPNVSRDARADRAPWRTKITVPGHLAPSHPIGAQNAPPSVIGTFQGARYRTDFYRAAARCMMLRAGDDFCPVCRDHLRTRI